jgi:hypothetical protein
MKHEFAIKKDILNSGEIVLTPVVRLKSKYGRFLNNKWNRITKIYGVYMLMELDFDPKLTREECKEHIQGYQQALRELNKNQVETIEFDTLEEKDI